jgi:hypothetical protein
MTLYNIYRALLNHFRTVWSASVFSIPTALLQVLYTTERLESAQLERRLGVELAYASHCQIKPAFLQRRIRLGGGEVGKTVGG